MTLAPKPEYHSSTPSPTPTRPERQGVSRRSVIEEAKYKLKAIDLADLLCGPAKLRRLGAEWIGRCPLADHEDRVPSFAVNTEKNVWFCQGCLRDGDVIELARHAWGYSKGEVAMAAAQLLHEFGHEIPKRPAAWFRKQERQATIRSGIEHTQWEILLRRLFKWFILPLIDAIQDEEERQRDLERAWADFRETMLS